MKINSPMQAFEMGTTPYVSSPLDNKNGYCETNSSQRRTSIEKNSIDVIVSHFETLYKGFYSGRSDNPKAPLMRAGDAPKPMSEVENSASIVAVLKENVLMIDCDTQEDVTAMDAVLAKMRLVVPTLTTTRGKHYYFSNEGVECKCISGVRLACGIKADIKNGVSTAFDCIKLDGSFRNMVNGDKPLPLLPDYLKPLSTKLDTYSGLSEGSRNNVLMNELGVLKRYGFEYQQAVSTLSIMNACVFTKGVPQSEFNTVTRQKLFDNAYVGKNKQANKSRQELMNGDNTEGATAGSERHDLAMHMIEAYQIINMDKLLMRYDNGAYVPMDREEFERHLYALYPNSTVKQRNEVYSIVFLLAPRFTASDTDKYLDYYVFANGTFKLERDAEGNATMRKVDNDPSRLIFNRIDVEYKPEAYELGGLVDTFIKDISCNNGETGIQIMEMMGHCLMRKNIYRAMYILMGKTANGKSTLLKALSNMLGRDNVSFNKLHQLNNRFSKWSIGNKLANIGDDISGEFVKDTNIIKSITTSDTIAVERKGKDEYFIRPYCTLIFSTNELPRLNDATGATLNRISIIPFDATFNRAHPNYDPNIEAKLCTKEAKEALLALAVMGLLRINSAQGVSVSTQMVWIKNYYAEQNNPVLGFIHDKYWNQDVPFLDGNTCNELKGLINKPIREIYDEYLDYCQDENLTRIGKTKFTHKFVSFIYNSAVRNVQVNHDRTARVTSYNGELSLCLSNIF